MKRFSTFLALAAVLAIAGPAKALAPPDLPDECLLADDLPVTTLARDTVAPASSPEVVAPASSPALEPAEASLPWCPENSREQVPVATRWPAVLPLSPQTVGRAMQRPPAVQLTSVVIDFGNSTIARLTKKVHRRTRLV